MCSVVGFVEMLIFGVMLMMMSLEIRLGWVVVRVVFVRFLSDCLMMSCGCVV